MSATSQTRWLWDKDNERAFAYLRKGKGLILTTITDTTVYNADYACSKATEICISTEVRHP